MKPQNFPKVSFLVPAFNHGQFIERTLDSVLRDSYPNKELIVIDDGSSDNTSDITKAWIQKSESQLNVRFVGRDNRGVTKTLNELIRMSTGNYFRILASDDILIPDGTTRLMEAILKADGKCAAAGDCEVIDKNDRKIADSVIRMNGGNPEKMKTEEGLCKQIIAKWAFAGPSILIEKNYFCSVGLYNENSTVEDWDSYLRLVAQKKLVAIPSKVARYRIHDNNSSRTKDVSRRLHNQISQLRASQDHTHSFTGQAKILLLARQQLLQAKIHYLSKSNWKMVRSLAAYLFYELRARLTF